jgi:hypothetical protein
VLLYGDRTRAWEFDGADRVYVQRKGAFLPFVGTRPLAYPKT